MTRYAGHGLNERERAFCDHYISNGGNGTKAAIAAGYSEKSAHVQASTLLKRPKIQKGLEDRQRAGRERCEISLESLTDDFREVFQAASKDQQHGAAVSALTAVAKLHGLWVDKSESQKSKADAINEAELERTIKQLMGKMDQPVVDSPALQPVIAATEHAKSLISHDVDG